jgi:hypothetical protein
VVKEKPDSQGYPNHCRTGFHGSKKTVGKPVKLAGLLV